VVLAEARIFDVIILAHFLPAQYDPQVGPLDPLDGAELVYPVVVRRRVNLLPFPVVVELGMGFFFGPGSGGSGD
jgi:hypothetical protein